MMLVQLQTRFCLLCVITVLFPQSQRCHETQADKHHHTHHHHHHSHDHHDQSHHHDHNNKQNHSHSHPHHGHHPHEGATIEEEQQFYISQLFSRYSTSDRLDFSGFQSLLLSLGLGTVKLVEVDHEELGHDHVAHLDILDVQAGLHSHSASSGGHGHGHAHGHAHGHKHAHESSEAQTEPAPVECTTAASPARKVAHKPSPLPKNGEGEPEHPTHKKHQPHSHHGHSHGDHHHHHHHDDHHHHHDDDHHHHHDDHDHHHHHHEETQQNGGQTKEEEERTELTTQHNSTHDHSDPGSGVHFETTEPEHKQGETQNGRHEAGGHDHDHDHDHPHETQPESQGLTTAENPNVSPDSHHHDDHDEEERTPSSTAPPAGLEERQAEGRDRRRKGKGLKGRGRAGERETREREGGGGGSRRKREVRGAVTTPTAPALMAAHLGGSTHQHEECLNLTQLLTDFGLSPDSLISPVQFSYLCPALLYQIDRRLCLRHYHNLEVESQALEPPDKVMVWVWGFVSITIISLLSLLGVILVPILHQGCFKFLLTFLVALAVGTLSGDALLHLLPHSQGQHDHSEAPGSSSDLATEFDGVWKGLMALGGIYLLFIIEHCMGMYKHYRKHKSAQGGADEGGIGRKLSDHKLNRRSDAEWLHLKALPEDADGSATCDNGLSDTQLTDVQTPDSPSAQTSPTPDPPTSPTSPSPKSNGHKAQGYGHSHGGHSHSHGGHSHGGHCHSDQDMKEAGIASIAWMVIMGDGMHNFSDGLAIGAAFSANLTGGISTSVAVFCHELPHELGDFAVLLKAGMSVKQAIVYNVLSALMAYVGMVIGTAVGQYTHNVTSWIFAITAGMFLYVALVDMLPEMLHGDSEDHKRCQVGHFLLQNLGLLSGFSIMLLIAIFEDKIVFDFGF